MRQIHHRPTKPTIIFFLCLISNHARLETIYPIITFCSTQLAHDIIAVYVLPLNTTSLCIGIAVPFLGIVMSCISPNHRPKVRVITPPCFLENAFVCFHGRYDYTIGYTLVASPRVLNLAYMWLYRIARYKCVCFMRRRY